MVRLFDLTLLNMERSFPFSVSLAKSLSASVSQIFSYEVRVTLSHMTATYFGTENVFSLYITWYPSCSSFDKTSEFHHFAETLSSSCANVTHKNVQQLQGSRREPGQHLGGNGENTLIFHLDFIQGLWHLTAFELPT